MEQIIDIKIVAKVNKLLNLARDGGATEGEANSAMEMAQRIMLENNITMATVEAAGQSSEDGKRVKETVTGGAVNSMNKKPRSWAMYRWQRDLMEEIGRINFCLVTVAETWTGRRHQPSGYNIFGREGNVVSAKEMFSYLMNTINRLILDHNMGDHKQNMSKYSLSWKEGCADRLRERLSERHDAMMKEQEKKAKEEQARSRHPASASTGTSLVVVMTDYAQREADLNQDARRNLEPGTTERNRLANQAKRMEQQKQTELNISAAKAAGLADSILSWIEFGYSIERAIERDAEEKAKQAKPETDAQRQKREAREDRQDRAYWNRQHKQSSRLDQSGYRAGKAAGDSIGLDKQVKKNDGTKLI